MEKVKVVQILDIFLQKYVGVIIEDGASSFWLPCQCCEQFSRIVFTHFLKQNMCVPTAFF